MVHRIEHAAFWVTRPLNGLSLPLVCDSPHSGIEYPEDFGAIQPHAALRRAEDTHIEALWSAAPQVGASLVEARFPRSYIDPNRALDDLDADMLDGPWPDPLQPGEKSKRGFGLIWRQLDADRPLYDRRLTVQEVRRRIDRCWQPYRQALQRELDEALQRFGAVWHLNLHSMPQNSYERLGLKSARPLADFVLGDRDGSTCEPGLMEVVERTLLGLGYTVARNDPFKGVALLAEIGRPEQSRHSLQIEVRRPLYMDEDTREPHAGFAPLQAHMTQVLQAVADHVRSRLKA